MKKLALALMLSVALLTPLTTRPFPWNVAEQVAILVANTGSALECIYMTRISNDYYNSSKPHFMRFFYFSHGATIAYLYWHATSQLWQTYKQYKHDKEIITIKG